MIIELLSIHFWNVERGLPFYIPLRKIFYIVPFVLQAYMQLSYMGLLIIFQTS